MQQLQEVPWFFLSHAGAQKDFSRRLYHELLHVGHIPFFEEDYQHRDSLHKGYPFAYRAAQACRGCKMGIIVMSHEYIESLWPMLELQHLIFHNSSVIIYPLFYHLQPADLSMVENLRRWKTKWDKEAKAWHHALRAGDINMDMGLWAEALEKLHSHSGVVLGPGMDEHAYIQAIVSSISKRLPPPPHHFPGHPSDVMGPWLGDHVIGEARMQQYIDNMFRHEHPRAGQVMSVGVYGVEGSGKSTLCKSMANFYHGHFSGRSYFLEFPIEEDDKQLIEQIKRVLSTLGLANHEELTVNFTIREALDLLQEGLKKGSVFLAIDNVWAEGSYFEAAKWISTMDFIAGSKLMVTSQSKQVLESLEILQVVHVPSITEEEALHTLKAYSGFLHPFSELEDLLSLSRSCFFRNHCHPLLLRAMGAKLREMGGHLHHAHDWEELILRLRAHNMHKGEEYEAVMRFLETSLHELPPKLQSIFIDLVTCVPCGYSTFFAKCGWLSMLHEGYTKEEMRYQIIILEYHGLLKIKEDEDGGDIYIDDLYKRVARRAMLRPHAHCRSLFEGDLSTLSKDEWKKVNVIHSVNSDYVPRNTLEIPRHCSKIEIFVLSLSMHHHLQHLSVHGMDSLRFLELGGDCRNLEEIGGWEGAPKLVSVKLVECLSLRKIGHMGSLRHLEELIMIGSGCMPDLSKCDKLRMLVVSKTKHLKDLSSLGRLPHKLQVLDLSENRDLMDVGALGTCTGLQQLRLHNCSRLENFPNIKLKNLITLDLSKCKRLKKLPDINASSLLILDLSHCSSLHKVKGSTLTALEELDVSFCQNLKKIPNLKSLSRLRSLKAEDCSSLKEVKLDISPLTSLEILDLAGCTSLAPPKSHSHSIGILELLHEHGKHGDDVINGRDSQYAGPDAFLHLQKLKMEGSSCGRSMTSLDVSGVASIVDLTLAHFKSLQEIRGLSALAHLEFLEFNGCSTLKEIAGLESLTKLENLAIHKSTHLKQILGLDVLSHSLKTLSISNSSMEALPQMPTSLVRLFVNDCLSLTHVFNLASLTSLELLDLEGCCWLKELPDLKDLTRLQRVNLRGCCSLRGPLDLRHLLGLESIYLGGCSSLQEAPQISSGVCELEMDHCTCLTRMWSLASHLPSLRILDLRGCVLLSELPDLRHLTGLWMIDIRGCSLLQQGFDLHVAIRTLYSGVGLNIIQKPWR